MDNNICFYKQIMPQPWRQRLLEAAQKNPKIVNEACKNIDSLQYFFMEAMAEVAPWFPEVVTYEHRGWLQNELAEILTDIQAQK